jgi:hypothetical protein
LRGGGGIAFEGAAGDRLAGLAGVLGFAGVILAVLQCARVGGRRVGDV